MKGSWRSTLSGTVALVAAITGALALVLDNDPNTNPDWNVTIALAAAIISQISGGVGLLFARDNVVTSEEAEAKGPSKK